MKISYFRALGVVCTVLNSVEVRAEASIAALAKEKIGAVTVAAYGECPVNYLPSKYLDNIYGLHCYQCIEGTIWNTKAHTCS